MEAIVKIKVGSHLYGTATPDSDLDIKGVYLPHARDILLQRIRPVISEQRIKGHGEKNTAGDTDYDLYSPGKYLSLLAQGQSMALEMLFAPDSVMLEPPHQQWNALKALAPHILTKQAASFVNYCKQQAYKYGVKGSRIAAARIVLEALIEAEVQYGPSAKLNCALGTLTKLANNNEFLTISFAPSQTSEILCLEVCGKKVLFNASIKSARLITQKTIDEYGARALAAESNEGADWKSLSHAVRIGNQAIEFLKDHHITFPRPEAKHLLEIKQGKPGHEQKNDDWFCVSDALRGVFR